VENKFSLNSFFLTEKEAARSRNCRKAAVRCDAMLKKKIFYKKNILMKNLIILISLLLIVSCNGQVEENRNKAKAFVKQANQVFLDFNLDEEKKLDSCIVLIDKAIKIDETYFNAYYTKTQFLTQKKDIKGLLKNNEKMISLRPTQPLWKIQRGLFFDIDGNNVEAEKYYAIGIKEYESLLEKPELKKDFNFRMEYVTALEGKGEIANAEKELENIIREFPENETLIYYKTEYKFKTKEEIIEFWKNGGEK